MCGIAGILNTDGSPVQAELVKRMAHAIAHRGPDDEGLYLDQCIGLGHRRLSIIDLSPAGAQPMCNEDGTIWITYNGEIYNFMDIRRELEQKGHQFRSATDTEVVVHAYEEWGTDCLHRFNGMFAFGLWDGRQQQLWLARDRIGIKPLFYARLPGCVLFGSEIKALFQHPSFDRTLDYAALSYYLTLNYTPAPYTLFANVRQVEPGHHLLVSASGEVRQTAYWDLTYHEGEDKGDRAYQDTFTELLEDAVRLRLVSDVPFGAFLSGGLDSSTTSYWMANNLESPVKTFSIGFNETSYSELAYARLTAHTIQSDHHERMVTADAASILPKIAWHAEEPTADSSMIPMYYLAQLAREHVTMVLSGDGADEILAGYETYTAYYLHRLYRLIPGWMRGMIQSAAQAIPMSDAKVSWDFKLRQFVRSGSYNSEDAHALWRMIFNREARRELLAPVQEQPGAQADVIDLYRAAFARTNAQQPLNRLLYVDTRFYLPSDMLIKVDRMTMAHGLEARVPFLDHRLVEFAASVPPRLKLKNYRQTKYLLKASMRGRLPDRVIWRKKEGFNVPNSRWIKGDLKPFVMDHLAPDRIKDIGLFDAQAVNNLLSDHLEERADNSHQIWCLLTLVLWWDHFITGDTKAREVT